MIICPECNGNMGYPDVNGYGCPECGHHWTDLDLEKAKEESQIRDSVGNILKEGDTISIIRDLNMGSKTIKRGTRGIQVQILEQEKDGHNISARVDGFGDLYLKSEVVRKA